MTDTTTEGWTPWGGGECPVARGLTVEVELRDGSKAIQVAGDWYWPHYGPTQIAGSGDIIAYRVVSPAPAVPDPVAAAETPTRDEVLAAVLYEFGPDGCAKVLARLPEAKVYVNALKDRYKKAPNAVAAAVEAERERLIEAFKAGARWASGWRSDVPSEWPKKASAKYADDAIRARSQGEQKP